MQKSPEELYREYQSTRDNIPQSVLKTIRQGMDNDRAEDAIHSILEQAKPLHGNPKSSTRRNEAKQEDSLLQKVRQWFNPGFQLGGLAVAGALAFALFSPMLELTPNTEGTYAQFSNCAECASYVANASVLTRSTAIGQKRIEPQQRLAARLGRLSAKFEIAKTTKSEKITANAFNELKKFSTANAALEKATSSLNIETALTALRNESKQHLTVFEASKALFIVNVSARNAHNIDASLLQTELAKALNFFERVANPSELQLSIINDLKALMQSAEWDERKSFEVIQLSRRGLETLG